MDAWEATQSCLILQNPVLAGADWFSPLTLYGWRHGRTDRTRSPIRGPKALHLNPCARAQSGRQTSNGRRGAVSQSIATSQSSSDVAPASWERFVLGAGRGGAGVCFQKRFLLTVVAANDNTSYWKTQPPILTPHTRTHTYRNTVHRHTWHSTTLPCFAVWARRSLKPVEWNKSCTEPAVGREDPGAAAERNWTKVREVSGELSTVWNKT